MSSAIRILQLILVFILIALEGTSQERITWKTLDDVRFTEQYSKEIDTYYYRPHFGSFVTAYRGKEVFLRGYIIAVSPRKGVYVLSRYPNASCYFCGSAGPESIVELSLTGKRPKFRMDQIATIIGRLKLNTDDLDHCNYILEDARLYEPDSR